MADLLSVIVGGGIGIMAGLIGPPYLHHLQQKAEKKKRRAEKFEELITMLYEHKHWLGNMMHARAFGRGTEDRVSPMTKVLAISSIYFPDFEKQIWQLDIAADQYELWMMEAEQKRLKGDSTFADGHANAHEPYTERFHSLLMELREFAKQEFSGPSAESVAKLHKVLVDLRGKAWHRGG
jgi:hypothetical protein